MLQTIGQYVRSCLLDSNPWWVAIGTGYLVLCVTVLILARTRWAQDRRFSACLILSVLAHGLLVGALGLVRTPEPPGAPDGTDGLRITLSSDALFVVEGDTGVDAAESELAASTSDLDSWPTEEPHPAATPEPESNSDDKVSQFAPADVDPSVGPLEVDDEPLPPVDEIPQAEAESNREETEEHPPVTAVPETAAASDSELSALPDPEAIPPDARESDVWGPATEGELVPDDRELVPVMPPDSVTDPTSDAVGEMESNDDAPSRSGMSPTIADSDPNISTPLARTMEVNRHERADSHYALRSAGADSQIAQRRGATPESEAAVRAALMWLAQNQHPDGRWDASRVGAGRGGAVDGNFRGGTGADADTGITGLALLAFLAAGHTHATGEHQVILQRGLEFLMRGQQEDGCLAQDAGHYARMYCHGIASLALCEAYGMSKDERLRPFAEDAIKYIAQSQHPVTGGWRYARGESGDMSQFGWQVMALVAGERAGIEVTAARKELAGRFLASVSRGPNGGLACYRPGEQIKVSMTAEALACRLLLHGRRDPAALAEGAQLVGRNLPGAGRSDFYYWYYGTLGLCLLGGDEWDRWNQALHAYLLPAQRTDGTYAGSWDMDAMWGGHGGRVYTTAMATLCLEAYYRYLPVEGGTSTGADTGSGEPGPMAITPEVAR